MARTNRWDAFEVDEMSSMADSLETSFAAHGRMDASLWAELLDAIEERAAGTKGKREERIQGIATPRRRGMRMAPVESVLPWRTMGNGSVGQGT